MRLTPTQRQYAIAHATTVLTDAVAAARLDDVVLAMIFRALSRSQEVEDPRRDEFGNWQVHYDEAFADRRYERPWLDELIFEKAGVDPLSIPARWPGGKRWALCLTHDVDSVTRYASLSKVTRPLRMAVRGKSGVRVIAKEAAYMPARLALAARHAGNDPLWRFQEWLKLEDKHGFKSTFLFVPYELEHASKYDPIYKFDDPVRYAGRNMSVAGMMREIDRAGWEVGLHGSYHAATRPGVLKAQKRAVEEVIGKPVVSTRQHYLHYDVALTPRLQAEAGLRVDSTQGWNRVIGFRAGTCFPYLCWDYAKDEPGNVWQVPMQVMDVTLHRSKYMGLGHDAALERVSELMSRVARIGGWMVVNWHTDYMYNLTYWHSYESVLAEAARQCGWCVQLRSVARELTGTK